MTYEVYRYISTGTMIAAIVFFIISLILFFAFRIPKVIGELSGRTARKAIQSLRQKTEQSMMEAEINTQKISTEVLQDNARASFEEVSNETTVLSAADSGQTTQLEKSEVMESSLQQELCVDISNFVIEKEIMFIHSNEVVSV